MSKQGHWSEPARELPEGAWEHFTLYKSVREAIATLPVYFRTETHISGILATDLHTLNTVLGATIEEQVVRTLNLIRTTWDPEGRYALYSFMRQPQTFPDVRLRRVGSEETLLGLELKGWYLLAKEAEPSLRFQVTAAACATADLIVVVPWVLGNVISGSPMLFEPFVESARFAADFRNYHWQHVRKTDADTAIDAPVARTRTLPRPTKSSTSPEVMVAAISGVSARAGMMDAYMAKLNDVPLCGIKTVFWRDFLKAFQESTTDAQVRAALERLRKRVVETAELPSPRSQAALTILAELERLLEIQT